MERKLSVVVGFSEEEPWFLLLLLAIATLVTVLEPGVTVVSKGGDKKGFVLLIFHNDMFGFFDKTIHEK